MAERGDQEGQGEAGDRSAKSSRDGPQQQSKGEVESHGRCLRRSCQGQAGHKLPARPPKRCVDRRIQTAGNGPVITTRTQEPVPQERGG